MIDSNGQSLAYVYGRAHAHDAQVSNGLMLDEARRIASNIASCQSYLSKEADRRTALGKCLLNRVTLCLEEVVILLPRPDCRREIGRL